MPNEDERDTPSPNSKSQPLPKSPVIPLTPQQDKMGKSADNPSNGEESTTVKLEKDIRSGERWLIGINATSIILSAVIAIIYYGQLQQMRKATKATKSAAETASATLKEIQKSGTDTHDLTLKQITASDRNASAAESFSGTAKTQAKTLTSYADVQLRIARLNYGAQIRLTPWMSFRWERDILYGDIAVYNQGKTPADTIQIAGRVEFLDSVPTDYTNIGAFNSTDPTALQAFDPDKLIWDGGVVGELAKKGIIMSDHAIIRIPTSKRIPHDKHADYAERTAYAWGKISFRDFAGGPPQEVKFCRFATGNLIFGDESGQGYVTKLECPTPQQ